MSPAGCDSYPFRVDILSPASLSAMHEVLQPALNAQQGWQSHVLDRVAHSTGLPELRAEALQLALQLGCMRALLQTYMVVSTLLFLPKGRLAGTEPFA
jgi:hypothetical protein